MAIYETAARERLASWEVLDFNKGIYRLIVDNATHDNPWMLNATFSSSTYIPEPEVIEPKMAEPGSLWEKELIKAGVCLDHNPNSGPGSDQCMTCGKYA